MTIMVSVCIATYNGVNYIREQLVSILCQLSSHDEIIISDDGSTDNTIDVLESIRDLRIKIIYNKGRHGVVPNFENALRNSTGDFIFFADQDDIWDEHKVARCMTALKDADLVVHNANVFVPPFYGLYNR